MYNKDKDYFEYLIKNILQKLKLIDDDFIKSEEPDFINDNIGLEITRADETLAFNGFINKYDKNNIKDILKFNEKFKECGGRVININDPIVKILKLKDTCHYNDNYIYIIPCYSNNFDFINKHIKRKLYKLNKNYNNKLKVYYLGIYTPIYANEIMIEDEFKIIKSISKQYNKKFEKIFIIFLDKICVFNLKENFFDIIQKTNELLNDLSVVTNEQLKN